MSDFSLDAWKLISSIEGLHHRSPWVPAA